MSHLGETDSAKLLHVNCHENLPPIELQVYRSFDSLILQIIMDIVKKIYLLQMLAKG